MKTRELSILKLRKDGDPKGAANTRRVFVRWEKVKGNPQLST